MGAFFCALCWLLCHTSDALHTAGAGNAGDVSPAVDEQGNALLYENFMSPGPKQPRETIRLKKSGGPLGLSICGGVDHSCHPFGANGPGIFVSKVFYSYFARTLIVLLY